MQNDDEILESLLQGGVIGGALGALLTGNKNGTVLGVLAGAAILASIKANKNAEKTNIPLVREEGNSLYEIQPDGTKRFIKSFPKNSKSLPKKFTLK